MIPNTTPTPNIIFNGLMSRMNDTEFRIVMLVVRATLGWEANKETGMRKVEDWISSSQLKKKTGRQSGAISKAIDHSIQEEWIEARSKTGEVLDTKGKRKGKNLYFRLGKAILFDTSSESEEVVVKDKKDYPTSSESEVWKVKFENRTLQKKPKQNKNIQKDNIYENSEKDFKKEIKTEKNFEIKETDLVQPKEEINLSSPETDIPDCSPGARKWFKEMFCRVMDCVIYPESSEEYNEETGEYGGQGEEKWTTSEPEVVQNMKVKEIMSKNSRERAKRILAWFWYYKNSKHGKWITNPTFTLLVSQLPNFSSGECEMSSEEAILCSNNPKMQRWSAKHVDRCEEDMIKDLKAKARE